MGQTKKVVQVLRRATIALGAVVLLGASLPVPSSTAQAADAPVGGGVRALIRAAHAADDDLVDDRDGAVDGIVAYGVRIDTTADVVTVELDGAPRMAVLDGVSVGSEFLLRSRNAGRWSEWILVEADDEDRPDHASTSTVGIGPIWIGHEADRLELRRLAGDPDPVDVELLRVADAPSVAELDHDRLRGAASSDPFIRPRSWWATPDMGWPASCGSAPDTGSVKALVVHHTAGTNGYRADDVPDIIRGVWRYHAITRGWCDIAYNFVVDRFGRVWEGRQGGIDRAIVGGHTFGFNSETTGIAQLGDFDAEYAPAAMTAATERLIGWKAGLHDVDPADRTVLTNRASTTARDGTPPGGSKQVPVVVGHRDLGSTTCPGRHSYQHMARFRANAAVGAHVHAMYDALVRRGPQPDTYLRWVDVALRSGVAAAADGIAYSDDYAGVAIDDLYRLILGRPADAGGRAYWLAYLASGHRIEEVATYFFGGEEYFAKVLRSNAAYVESLYRKILGRYADPGGLAHWTLALEEGRRTRPEVAADFYAAAESRRKRVDRLYRELLGRAPDPGGAAYWTEQLATVDELVLATFLVTSAEFRARFV